MRNLTINLLALVFIALAVLFSIPAAVVEVACVAVGVIAGVGLALVDYARIAFSGLRWLLNKITDRVVKLVFAVAGLSGALTVMAAETSPDSGLDLTSILLPFLLKAAAANPVVATGLAIFALAQPLIGLIANKTKNPRVGKVAIFGNKLLQMMSFNSSKNQPDVLSVREMLTTKPSNWQSKIRDKILTNAIGH
jgi:hypothetical protein